MWTSSPHLRPGGASRTDGGGERRRGDGPGHWPACVGGGGGLGHPLSPWPYPLCLVLLPSPLRPPPSLTLPLLSQTQQKAGPGFALLGTFTQVGAWSREALHCPGRTWGHWEKHGCRARARTSGPAPTPAWSGVIPACLLCLMGRPSHNLGAMLEPGTGSGLLHRNRVTEGVMPAPSAVCTLWCVV